ncbi:MAG: type IV toxin-antitoxin system AbiEi family antitoxin domain-containing protein, partial [Actinomycetota bacterium]
MDRECRRPDEVSQRVAATQHGLITLNQALEAGFTRRQIRWRLDSGQWTKVLPGVLAIAPPIDVWLQGLMAAGLWTGDAVIVGLASAGLWQLEGIAPGVIEIATATRKRHAAVIVHHGASFPHEDLIRHRGLLVTTPTRTLIDISGVV